ncbi:hypothetical protein [Desertivirga brevis]|uniref:hypothetical protein n=1 Tax=Desertivirga brevis TaxID=2810310 RepID=UPI001A968892|nr:hypothetical protein [Pedobacter sp. SYSU D00873]
MNETTIDSNEAIEAAWRKIELDLLKEDVLDYEAVIPARGREVVLDIDVDLGGGFEGGYASTSFSAILSDSTTFRFAIHREDFIDEIGKFFGMQDVKIGEENFDKSMLVRTNDEEMVRSVFSDESVRQRLLTLHNFSLGIHTHNVSGAEKPFLELFIEDEAITEIQTLKNLFEIFELVLQKVEKN